MLVPGGGLVLLHAGRDRDRDRAAHPLGSEVVSDFGAELIWQCLLDQLAAIAVARRRTIGFALCVGTFRQSHDNAAFQPLDFQPGQPVRTRNERPVDFQQTFRRRQGSILERIGGQFVQPQRQCLHRRGLQPDPLGSAQPHLQAVVAAVQGPMCVKFRADQLIEIDAVGFVQAREQAVYPC